MRIYSYYSYLVPVREQFCPPTSMQLLSTNKISDDNPAVMFVVNGRFPEHEIQRGQLMRGVG